MSDLRPSRLGRTDFQQLAVVRVKEAEALLKAKCPAGAYYLAGYAVECALKASIAKRFREFDFPDKAFVQKIYDHGVEQLMKLSELEFEFKDACRQNKDLDARWAIIKDWNEAKRYELLVSEREARDLIDAITNPNAGILKWIQQRW